jgi:pimeloyl-ACP methyl ester carboxylesterase
LLLWGIRDPWINAAGRRAAFQRHAPAATTEVVLEAGHCPHDEVPDQVNAALLEWIGGLSAAAAARPAADLVPAAGPDRSAA